MVSSRIIAGRLWWVMQGGVRTDRRHDEGEKTLLPIMTARLPQVINRTVTAPQVTVPSKCVQ